MGEAYHAFFSTSIASKAYGTVGRFHAFPAGDDDRDQRGLARSPAWQAGSSWCSSLFMRANRMSAVVD
jgi:hypothetical protein